MGRQFDKLYDWLGNGGIDMDLMADFQCGDCKPGNCDGCRRWDIVGKVADTVCEELYLLGKKLTKEWLQSCK